MQSYCTELTEKLLKSLDKEYNVVDMGTVVDVITALERTTITKKVLEITRLGKYINELRRKTNNDALAKRAKDLVRRWRDMVLPSGHAATPGMVAHIPQIETTAAQMLNGSAKPRSPAITKIFKPHSPMPLLRDAITPLKVLSPALSLNSDQSRSPNPASIRQLPTSQSAVNHRIISSGSPKLSGTSQNHSLEAVPRTHSSNKRLRKEDTIQIQPQIETQAQLLKETLAAELRGEPPLKKQRINGENVSVNINSRKSQVPSPSPTPDIIVVSDDCKLDITGDGPKKRGRKKGSKAMKNQLPQDRVKEKLASISRNPKLKTTQELLADLQARGSGQTPRPTTEPPTTEEILRASEDLTYGSAGRIRSQGSSRLSKSTNVTDAATDEKVASTDSIVNSRHDPTVEEILAKLPPLDRNAIRWSDDEEIDESPSPKSQPGPESVDRLHFEPIEGLNGNFQLRLTKHGNAIDDTVSNKDTEDNCEIKRLAHSYRRRVDDDDDREFREWHEMLARPTYDDQILHILPYVIID